MKHTVTYNHQSQFIEMTKNAQSVAIGDVCDILSGSTPSRANSLYWENGNIPWFTVEDLHEQGEYIGYTIQHVTEKALSKLNLYPKETVLLCCTSATTGKVAFANIELTSNQQFNGLVVKDKNILTPLFLFYACTLLKDELLRQCGKTTFAFVSKATLSKMSIPVPTLPIQEEFVKDLRQADKSKFGGFKSQFIELIRDCQTYLSISDLSLNFLKGISPTYVESSCVEVINQACVTWKGIDFSKVKYQNSEFSFAKGILNSDDLLLTMTGRGTLGRCNIFLPENDDITYIADSHISILRVNNTLVLPIIIARYISLSDTQDEICRNYVTGSTNQLDIVFSKIKNFKIPVPPMALQKEFAEIVRQADKSKYYVQNKLNYICHILTNQIQLRRCS